MSHPKEDNQMIAVVDLSVNKSHNKTGTAKPYVSMICLLRAQYV